MTPGEVAAVVDVWLGLHLISRLLDEALAREGDLSPQREALAEARRAVDRADATLEAVLTNAEVIDEGIRKEAGPDGRSVRELPQAGAADERWRVSAGGRPHGVGGEAGPIALPLRANVVAFHGQPSPAMTRLLRGRLNMNTDDPKGRRRRSDEAAGTVAEPSGEFDGMVDAAEPPEEISKTGFETVDPAAGGPQPQDTQADYNLRDTAHARASRDTGDTRSNPGGEPADPDPIE